MCSSSEGERDDDEPTAEEFWDENLVNNFFRRKEDDCTIWRFDRAMDGESDKDERLLKNWLFDTDNPLMTDSKSGSTWADITSLRTVRNHSVIS